MKFMFWKGHSLITEHLSWLKRQFPAPLLKKGSQVEGNVNTHSLITRPPRKPLPVQVTHTDFDGPVAQVSRGSFRDVYGKRAWPAQVALTANKCGFPSNRFEPEVVSIFHAPWKKQRAGEAEAINLLSGGCPCSVAPSLEWTSTAEMSNTHRGRQQPRPWARKGCPTGTERSKQKAVAKEQQPRVPPWVEQAAREHVPS